MGEWPEVQLGTDRRPAEQDRTPADLEQQPDPHSRIPSGFKVTRDNTVTFPAAMNFRRTDRLGS